MSDKQYPSAYFAVDCVVFAYDPSQQISLRVLLIRRAEDPFKDCWALPGGFVHLAPENAESCEEAAYRELVEETGLAVQYLEQLATFSEPDRDPRDRVISTAYMALVPPSAVTAGSDAREALWWPVNWKLLPGLAFDHRAILRTGIERLRSKIRWRPIGFDLLPETFTLDELQALYESVLGKKLDERNFRRRIGRYRLLLRAGTRRASQAGGRPSVMYRFDRERYAQMSADGFEFEV